MIYQIQTDVETFREVEAELAVIEPAGCLSFYDGEVMVLALAPGQWLTVHQEEAGKAALRRIHG